MVERLRNLTSNNYAKPNGFSLPELLIAAGLSFLVVLASAVLIENLLGQDRAMKGALTADTQLDQADYIIQRYFRTAVDLKIVGSISSSDSLTPASEGKIVTSFVSDPSSGTPAAAQGDIIPLALFYRDTATVAPPTGNSSLKPTGMYFQQPGPDSYGVLYIDDGANGTTLGPALNNVVVDHIVSLEVGSAVQTVMPTSSAPSPQYIRSFQMTVTIRLPTYTNGNGAMNWCGDNQSTHNAACTTGKLLYKDTTRQITVIVYNNYDPQATPGDGPALGRVYFAK